MFGILGSAKPKTFDEDIPSCLDLTSAKLNLTKLPGVVDRFERSLSPARPAAARPAPAFVSQVRTRMNNNE